MAKKETLLSVAKEIRDVLVTNSTLNKIVKGVKELKESVRFIKNEDGTVIDKKTGLMWGPALSFKLAKDAGPKACAECKVGGHTDWRVPTVEEYCSIINRKKRNPCVDTEIFPDTKSDWYWTCEDYADDSGVAWVVNFYNGNVFSDVETYGYYVRPVRSSQ